jgi:hypothetical protein
MLDLLGSDTSLMNPMAREGVMKCPPSSYLRQSRKATRHKGKAYISAISYALLALVLLTQPHVFVHTRPSYPINIHTKQPHTHAFPRTHYAPAAPLLCRFCLIIVWKPLTSTRRVYQSSSSADAIPTRMCAIDHYSQHQSNRC